MSEPNAMTVAEWRRIAERHEGDVQRELLDGEMIVRAPMSGTRADCVARLHSRLVSAVEGRAAVQIHTPVVLDDVSEPRPDLALTVPSGGSPDGPGPGILLVVEVTDSNQDLIYNRGRKAAYYARSGVPECWIVDLQSEQVLVHRNPASGGYRDIRNLRGAAILEVEALPGVSLGAAEIVGP